MKEKIVRGRQATRISYIVPQRTFINTKSIQILQNYHVPSQLGITIIWNSEEIIIYTVCPPPQRKGHLHSQLA